MQVSATILGQDYGLTGEEMNRVLVKQGFLQGKPGDYSATQKAMKYAVENDFHRGTGGYAHYNRYWTTRTFDNSIKEVLDVSNDLISEVRNEIASDRAARYATQAMARVQANASFLAKQAAEKTSREATEIAVSEAEELIAKWKKVGKIGLIIGGALTLGYGMYKVTPHVKQRWKERNDTNFDKDDAHIEKEATKMQMCPFCDHVYDESEYSRCPYCYPEKDEREQEVIVYDRKEKRAKIVSKSEAEKYIKN